MGTFEAVNGSQNLRIKTVEAPQFIGNTPLIGREEELLGLSGHAEACLKSQQSAGVIIVGPAGMGKSHIGHALTSSACGRFQFSWGCCVA